MIVALASSTYAASLTPQQQAECKKLGLDEKQITELIDKPLYKCNESEVDTYLKFLSATEPDLRKRILTIARKNIGQPYELYLLGEMPFEPYDPQPIYCLGKSDCLVFTEHTYAMALSHNWPSFMMMLQRIRYRDGHMGVATRNHYTEADWNISNNWLVEDITKELAGDAAKKFSEKIDRSKFLKNRYGLTVSVPVENHEDEYIPYEKIDLARSQLQDGDFVNIVRATSQDAQLGAKRNLSAAARFVGHVGLIGHGPDGIVHLIHSTEPKVREEPIDDYIKRATKDLAEKDEAGKPRLVGFKFLRLREDPLKNLQKVDGPTPRKSRYQTAKAPRSTVQSPRQNQNANHATDPTAPGSAEGLRW